MGWFLIMPYTVEGTVEMAGKEIPVSLTGIPTGGLGQKVFLLELSVHL